MFKNLMIFAAGLGKRMVPVTQTIPKPLIKIHGKPILYYILEQALEYNFNKIVINTHYLAAQVKQAIDYFIDLYPESRKKVVVVHEEVLLETGGGIKNAKNYFDEEVIFTANSDSFVVNEINPFKLLAQNWKEHMHSLMLLQDINKAVGYKGKGDFSMRKDGTIFMDNISRPFVYTGIQLINITPIVNFDTTIFSLKEFFNRNNMYGVVNNGQWYHLTSPDDIQKIEKELKIIKDELKIA